jgi:hypothetical protein
MERYKARWVLRGFTQQLRIDYDETFSLVVRPATVQSVLSLALSRNWPIHQLDVKNAFLHNTLTETVYCNQPTGFVDPTHPNLVCLPHKSLYSMKQTPRAWYSRFASYLLSIGFAEAKSDTSLFLFHRGSEMVYLLLYVDDIVLTASSTKLLQRTISALQKEFAMKDLCPLHHFLGITVEQWDNDLFLHQHPYIQDILERAGMTDCKLCITPIDIQAKIAANSGSPVIDPTQFRSLVGALQYLTFTRPDISYVVQQVCLCLHDPWEPHLVVVKRILHYLQGTLEYGLLLHRSSVFDLVFYTDTDWLDARTHVAPPLATLSSSMTTTSPGPRSARTSSLVQVRRSSIVLSPTTWLRCAGYANYFRSSTTLSHGGCWSTATGQRRPHIYYP